MAEQIKCPICGELNDTTLELCTNCRSPLKPKENIRSGQIPTKKNTAELEPILPQWLRDARDAAKNTEPQDSPSFMSQQDKPKPASSTPDLLAGLQSQAEDNEEEEVPDWLASITGASPKSKPAKNEPVTDVRWVEMGGKDDFAQSEQSTENESDVPPWLAGLQENAQPEKDELTDWLRETDETPQPFSIQANMPSSEGIYETSEPVLFSSEQDDTPDWLKQMSANAEAEEMKVEAQVPQDAPELNIDTPDWLSSLGSSAEKTFSLEADPVAETSTSEPEAEFIPSMDMPDWLKTPSQPEVEKPIDDTTTPLWLRKPKLENEEPEMPAWLSSEETIHLSESKSEEAPVQDDLLSDLPDWLKAAAPQSSIFDEPEKDELKSEVESPSDSVNWFKSVQSTDTPVTEEPLVSEIGEAADPFASMPTFTPDAETTNENLEGLFTDMPDWLSDETPASSSTPTPMTQEDVLPTSSLPSWVEAMRPSDSGIQQPSSFASDQTLESRGALAGLQGVLPAMAGFAPTSKPKAYSLKLNASDEQQRHAGILEEILAAETAPVPLESFSTLRTSRSLRWTLTILMLAIVAGTTFLKTQIFSLPRGVPSEVNAAIQIAQSIPENAPVLVAFDYEPSRAGEMEVAAAPLFDQLLLLKHPRLTLIATNETGSTLAERFITGPLAIHNYQSGVTYSNLGYLPGGQLGIRAFAQNPTVTAPFDTSFQPAWSSAPLQGVASLSQFTAMILITDNADAARVWVEQTESLRGDIPFIVISSSQAAPMIQPYYDSGQVSGIVPGLYGGAIFEQYNAGRPGTARNYWDAYSIGMLIAMSLVLGGGLWNLIIGMRERAALREEN